MTGDQTVDRTIRWIGTVGLYLGILVDVAVVIWFFVVIVIVNGNIGQIPGLIVLAIIGGLMSVAGGYLTHYWGVPWEAEPRVKAHLEADENQMILDWENEPTTIRE